MEFSKKLDEKRHIDQVDILKNTMKHSPKYFRVQWDVSISKDGEFVAFVDNRRISILHSYDFKEYMTFDHGLYTTTNIKFDYSGDRLYCTDMIGTLKCFNITPEANCIEEFCYNNLHQEPIITLEYSLNYIATGSRDFSIKLLSRFDFDLENTFEGHSDHVNDIAISSDETILISGSKDRTIVIWDLISKCKFSVIEKSFPVWCLTFIPDNISLIVGYYNGSIERISIIDGSIIQYFYGHTKTVCDVAIYSSKHIISTSYDTTIKFWNLETGICLDTISGHVNGSTISVHEHDFIVTCGFEEHIQKIEVITHAYPLISSKKNEIYLNIHFLFLNDSMAIKPQRF
eukprot:gene2520-3226_t